MKQSSLKILILGVNGFIGSHLIERILHTTNWQVTGFDLQKNNIDSLLTHPNFTFKQGDIFKESAWLEDAVQKVDIVIPLIAIANPALYVKQPLRVFELDFESNLAVVKLCVKYQKRLIFPSTSEVYGMSTDTPFNEETSNLVLGPINKPRWIYSCSKQMLDRVIAAYGSEKNLNYTLFRPFNFMGPRLDNLHDPKEGASRAFTQFVGNIMRKTPIMLVGGGTQHRCYIYINDAIDAIIKIIENKNNCAAASIFNIGNPSNDVSMAELATMIIDEMKKIPKVAEAANLAKIQTVNPEDYFGAGYQDVSSRVPSIERAKTILHWIPTTSLRDGIRQTLQYYFS